MLVYYICEFITKENKAEGSFLQNRNLRQVRLSSLAPSGYTVIHIWKCQWSINLKKGVKWCRNLAIRPAILLFLEAMQSMCCFQVKCLSIRTPRNSTYSLFSKVVPAERDNCQSQPGLIALLSRVYYSAVVVRLLDGSARSFLCVFQNKHMPERVINNQKLISSTPCRKHSEFFRVSPKQNRILDRMILPTKKTTWIKRFKFSRTHTNIGTS